MGLRPRLFRPMYAGANMGRTRPISSRACDDGEWQTAEFIS
jgi:hypothetical protein